MDPQIYFDIKPELFIVKAKSYKDRGWRFVNLCGSSVDKKVEILCSFAKADKLENLRFLVTKNQQLPAISPLYPSAFFFENETCDLFGVQFKGTIVDFGGRFYPTSVPTPMNPGSLQAQVWGESSEVAATLSPCSPELVSLPSEVPVEPAKTVSDGSGEEASNG